MISIRKTREEQVLVLRVYNINFNGNVKQARNNKEKILYLFYFQTPTVLGVPTNVG